MINGTKTELWFCTGNNCLQQSITTVLVTVTTAMNPELFISFVKGTTEALPQRILFLFSKRCGFSTAEKKGLAVKNFALIIQFLTVSF